MLWFLAYAGAFVAAFAVSAFIKLTWSPLSGRQQVIWDEGVGVEHLDLAYGEGPFEKFDLYLPAGAARDAYGLVVYLHPGGFTAGDKSGDAEMCRYLCSKGYVSASINYTLRTEENTASVASMSQDIKRAMPEVVQAAARLGYPVDRMAIGGGSAGGCLALLYAYRDADEAPVPVTFVFEAVGPASFEPEDWYGLDSDPAAAAVFFSVLSGNAIAPEMVGTPAYAEAVRDISAWMWVDKDSAPTLCAYGAHDKVCPFATARHLVVALEQHNVPHDYLEFPHSGHGLQNDDDLSARYADLLDEYLERYLG